MPSCHLMFILGKLIDLAHSVACTATRLHLGGGQLHYSRSQQRHVAVVCRMCAALLLGDICVWQCEALPWRLVGWLGSMPADLAGREHSKRTALLRTATSRQAGYSRYQQLNQVVTNVLSFPFQTSV
jgi:hypothetical protein